MEKSRKIFTYTYYMYIRKKILEPLKYTDRVNGFCHPHIIEKYIIL